MNPAPPHEEEVRLGDVGPSMLPVGRPPKQDDCVLHGGLPLTEQVNVIVSQPALKQIKAHCESNLQAEVGGVLLGQAYRTGKQVYVQIEAAIPALSNDHGPVHFTFTADAWAQIHVDRSQYTDMAIVGWFHTHPDLGVFFSADDEVVHAAAFTQPWHVGLVVDPVRDQASFFGWQHGDVRALAGFYELIPASAGSDDEVPRSVIDWAVVVDDSWLYSQPVYGARYRDSTPPLSPWVPTAIASVALIVALIALYVALQG